MTRRMLYCYILTPLSSQYTITKCQISTYTPTFCTLSNMQDTGTMFLLTKAQGTAVKGLKFVVPVHEVFLVPISRSPLWSTPRERPQAATPKLHRDQVTGS